MSRCLFDAAQWQTYRADVLGSIGGNTPLEPSCSNPATLNKLYILAVPLSLQPLSFLDSSLRALLPPLLFAPAEQLVRVPFLFDALHPRSADALLLQRVSPDLFLAAVSLLFLVFVSPLRQGGHVHAEFAKCAFVVLRLGLAFHSRSPYTNCCGSLARRVFFAEALAHKDHD